MFPEVHNIRFISIINVCDGSEHIDVDQYMSVECTLIMLFVKNSLIVIVLCLTRFLKRNALCN